MLSLPDWLRWYKKPNYTDFKSYAASLKKKFEQLEEDGVTSPRSSFISARNDVTIPKKLRLERVLSNKTCSPMSLYDFYMYLKHVEFSQENLEFYLWFKDYEKRYQEALNEKNSETSVLLTEKVYGSGDSTYGSTEELGCSTCEYSTQFTNYIESIVASNAAVCARPCCPMPESVKSANNPVTKLHERRQEIHEIIELFLTTGAPKELNIPPSMRKAAIAKLATSDSPEHLSKISDHVYALLKNCSHRNFVRLGVNNGTFETLCMVTFVGITFTLLGFLVMFLLAFASPSIHHSSRWRGLATIPFWLIGLSFLFAGWRGSCFLLLMVSRRQELPWERVEEDQSIISVRGEQRGVIRRFMSKLMIFERKIKVKDVGLRRLQHKIVVQSIVGALIGTTLLEVFFLSLPMWKQ